MVIALLFIVVSELEIVVVILVLVLIVVLKLTPVVEVAEVEESGGLGSEISGQIQQNPVEDIPQTNPFEAETNPFGETQANPFEDVYKNPFGQ